METTKKQPTRFRIVRTSKGYSLAFVASQTKINPTALSAVELGKNNPRIPALIDLANFYNVSLDYLLGKSSITFSVEDLTKSDRFLLDLFIDISKLPKDKIRELSTIVENLKNK